MPTNRLPFRNSVRVPLFTPTDTTGAFTLDELGLTHASMVKSVPTVVVNESLTYAEPPKKKAESALLTRAPAAPPETPSSHPVWPLPDASAAVDPEVSPSRQ